MGAAGAAAHVRVLAVGQRDAGRGDSPAGRALQHRTTEVTYRRELRPVLTRGAEAMDAIFE
jgi:hypothetical protein